MGPGSVSPLFGFIAGKRPVESRGPGADSRQRVLPTLRRHRSQNTVNGRFRITEVIRSLTSTNKSSATLVVRALLDAIFRKNPPNKAPGAIASWQLNSPPESPPIRRTDDDWHLLACVQPITQVECSAPASSHATLSARCIGPGNDLRSHVRRLAYPSVPSRPATLAPA
jgi:hypothetical protein